MDSTPYQVPSCSVKVYLLFVIKYAQLLCMRRFRQRSSVANPFFVISSIFHHTSKLIFHPLNRFMAILLTFTYISLSVHEKATFQWKTDDYWVRGAALGGPLTGVNMLTMLQTVMIYLASAANSWCTAYQLCSTK